ncbi:hypothetical protein MMC20_005187 [Loxospora ochrophaea]|nr:hypothetical protein [Loxospora ochrophaea]
MSDLDASSLSVHSSSAGPECPELETIKNVAAYVNPPTTLAHRSHDPSNNLKRSYPFQFGSRYLLPEDNVYEFNAWDHVETDPVYKAYAEQQYASQRLNPVSTFDAKRFNSDPEKWWDKFYTNNTSNFFKNRKWLEQEFPVLEEVTRADAGRKAVLEVGAGAGNTAFPILATNGNNDLTIYACDFSKKAVGLIKENEAYDGQRIKAEVWDVSSSAETLPPGVEERSIDIVMMVFVFSALHPSQWKQAVENVSKALRPGGVVCFRGMAALLSSF